MNLKSNLRDEAIEDIDTIRDRKRKELRTMSAKISYSSLQKAAMYRMAAFRPITCTLGDNPRFGMTFVNFMIN